MTTDDIILQIFRFVNDNMPECARKGYQGQGA
jgi:hypothetical protein